MAMKSNLKAPFRISNLNRSAILMIFILFLSCGQISARDLGIRKTESDSIKIKANPLPIDVSIITDGSLSKKICCFLPFSEDWTTGQFDVNMWTVDDNWIMDGSLGNAAPSAKFKSEPIRTIYSKSLTSFYLNAQMIQTETPFSICLEFDIKLDDKNNTGSERMQVEILLPSDTIPVMLYKNDGDFDWKTELLDISEYAKNTNFRFRFNANGETTENINSWWIDNIHVNIVYHFYPPINLQATRVGTPQNDILLTWQKPTQYCITPGSYFQYDNGINESGVGNNQPGKFSVAVKFDSLDLAECVGKQVKRIKFFPKEELCNYSIRIWDKIGVALEQPVLNPVIGSWNDITLDDPYLIDNQETMHVGYLCDPQSGYPAGIDAGPATAGKGDLISYDNGKNWRSLALDHGINANLNIAAFIEEPETNFNPIYQFWIYRKPYQIHPGGIDPNMGDTTAYNQIALVSGETFSFLDENLPNELENCYNYYVRANYPEGYSPNSNLAWDCIFVSSETAENDGVKLFPNPATSFVRIESAIGLTEIKVYNSFGNKVYGLELANDKNHVLRLDCFTSGLYSVVLKSSNGKIIHKTFLKL